MNWMVIERRALVFHNRLIRPGSAANVDHIAVTPGGVLVGGRDDEAWA